MLHRLAAVENGRQIMRELARVSEASAAVIAEWVCLKREGNVVDVKRRSPEC